MTNAKTQSFSDISIGPFKVLSDLGVIEGPVTTHRLEPKVMAVLGVLAAEPGRVLPREQLINDVWSVEFGADESLTRAISLLRKIFKEDDPSTSYIETVPKRGYRLLIKPVSLRSDTAMAAPGRTGDSEVTTEIDFRATSILETLSVKTLLATLFAFLLGVALTVWLWPRFEPAETTISSVSVAVLPFDSFSNDAKQAFFSKGISEEIQGLLSNLSDLNVTGRTSSVSVEGNKADIAAIGRTLKVSHVLDGSVRFYGDRVRVTAQLIDAKDGFQIWSRTFERDVSAQSLFGIQRDVAHDVAGALSISLGIANANVLLGSDTKSLAAYDEYLQARNSDRFGSGNRDQALEHFRRAVDIDPDYAAAWSGLAITVGSESWNALSGSEARAIQEDGRKLAVRAIELAPSLAHVHSNFASFEMARGDWAAAKQAHETALELARNSGTLSQYAMFLLCVGNLSEALRAAEEAYELDQLNESRSSVLAMVLTILGRQEQADEALVRSWGNRTESRDWDSFAWTIALHSEQSRTQLAALTERLASSDQSLESILRPILDVWDDEAAALNLVEALAQDAQIMHADQREIMAALAAHFSDADLALRIWRLELDGNRIRILRIWGPLYAEMRSLPEFKRLVRELGLVEYWQSHGWPDRCLPVTKDDFECS